MLAPTPDPVDPLPLDFVPSDGLVLSVAFVVEKAGHRVYVTAMQADGEVKLSHERQTWEVKVRHPFQQL